MRIFFCGAQGTGKSTLVNELKFILPEYETMDSPSRLFIKEGEKRVQRSFESKEYMDFQKKIILHCLNYYVLRKNFYSSRSIIDSYAYINYALKHSKNSSVTIFLHSMLSVLDTYLDFCFEEDTVYFYLPIEFEIGENNSLRDTDSTYQKEIDELIKSTIKYVEFKFNCKIHTLTGKVQERVERIKKTLL